MLNHYINRAKHRAVLNNLLKDDGILVIPTIPDYLSKHSSKRKISLEFEDRLLILLSLAGLSGCCQVAVPLGKYESYPISISFIATHGADKFLLDTVLDMYSSLQKQISIASSLAPLPDFYGEMDASELLKEKVVRLYKRRWIDEKSYPRFTMIGQSLGSVYLSWEALHVFTPEFFFDTSGYAFTYPLARVFGCKVICYTHYPTVSSDMISRICQQSSMYNNDALVAKSVWLSRCKIGYYIFFSWLYGLVGSCAHLVMVNSSWTRSHIENLWKIHNCIKIVYPPCDTLALQALPLKRCVERAILISVAQFRPEKAHGIQLEAFALVVNRLGPNMIKPKLQFVGSCRNNEDEQRLQKLKNRAIELDMEDMVEFYKDVKYSELVKLLGGAIVGLHSMIDEHFGISVVEYMAAGAIPISHNSAGPRMDIILEDEDGHQSGFLASSKEEYADVIFKVLRMEEPERLIIAAAAARKRAEKFSERVFYEDFKSAIQPIFSRSSTPT